MIVSCRRLSLLLPLYLNAASTQGQEELTCEEKNTVDAVAVDGNQPLSEGTGSNTDISCVDDENACVYWASIGECQKNPSYMELKCRKSCRICDDGLDLGEEQLVSGDNPEAVKALIEKTKDYVKNTVMVDPQYDKVRDYCKNFYMECSIWAVDGACETDPEIMGEKCAPACQNCHELEQNVYELRCPMDDPETMPNAWGPGDLNKMFEKLVTKPEYKKYEPRILSRPVVQQQQKLTGENHVEESANDGPWVVLLEKFASGEECETLIQLGGNQGYERSVEWDESMADKIQSSRTSSTAWCDGDCATHPLAQQVMDRIANVTAIPKQNQEPLQLLKYEQGQFYVTHSDCNYHEARRQQGVRTATVFLYLNNVPDNGGGGTNFPELGITVQPKRGSALIWPNVLDEDPDEPDLRTKHQALPVLKGSTKYGANAWLHQRDFQTPTATDCL